MAPALLDHDGRLIPLHGRVTHVGRGLGADLRFDEADISRRHAALVVWPDGVRLLDEHGAGAGGVRVNGRRVSAATLCDGDTIELGSVVLTFVAGAPLSAAA
jgi:pSer/pThr/pTyr-binding forkhead associated (FHA) protein